MSTYGAANGVALECSRTASPSRQTVGMRWILVCLGAVVICGSCAVVFHSRAAELFAPSYVHPIPANVYNIYSQAQAKEDHGHEDHERTLREAAYWAAIRSAQTSQAGMAELIRHYYSKAPTTASYPTAANYRDYQDLQVASQAWERRRKALEVLEQEITREQSTLEQMHSAEESLRERHDALSTEIARLVDQAEEMDSQITALKGQYGQQVHDLRLQDKATQENIREEKYALERELLEADKNQEVVHKKLASAMSKAAYYNEQAAHAEQDVEAIRTRSKAKEQEEVDMKKEMANAESMAIDQEAQAAESMAKMHVAQMTAKAIQDVSRIKQQGAIVVEKRRAKALKLEGELRVQEALGQAARKAEEAATSETDEVEDKVKKLDQEVADATQQVFEAKGKAGDARVEAVEFMGKENLAKENFDEIQTALRYTRHKIAAANELLENADAKEVMLESQTKIQQLIASTARSMADAKAEEAVKATEESEATVAAETAAAAALRDQHEGLQQEALAAKSDSLAAQATAKLTSGQADLQDSATKQLIKSAMERRRKAEALLRSVNELTRLAKHAADMAQVERIKAETAAALPETQGAWFGPFQSPPCAGAGCGSHGGGAGGGASAPAT